MAAARWLILVALFTYFCNDGGTNYVEQLHGLFGWLEPVFLLDLPYKVRLLDHIFILSMVLAAGKAAKNARVPQMRTALYVSAATVVAFFVLGIARGGDFRCASWQVYLLLSGVLLAFCVASSFRTPEHFVLLGKMLLGVAAYRALMCWICHFFVVPSMKEPPQFLTSHDDTVVWVPAMLIALVRMIDYPSALERLKAGAYLVFIAGAVQFNSRRLAWVSLAMGVVVLYALYPAGKVKRRITRTVLTAVPILLLYVVVGWGRPETPFRPLRAFATVSTQEDASTKARNVENLGLIATAQQNWLLGTGWGHKYIEVSRKYSIAEFFELWPYIPHNSVLGTLAFTGALGFFGYWFPFPTAMFLNTRLAKLGSSKLAREVGILGAAQMVVCANQCYGDMGTFSARCLYVLSVSYAIALRLPVVAGAWTAPKKAVRPKAERSRVAPAAPQAHAGVRA